MPEKKLIVLTLPHLSQTCAQECKLLGYPPTEITPLGFSIPGDMKDAMWLNLQLRSANRILWPIRSFHCNHPDHLYKETKATAWERYLEPSGYFSVHGYVKHLTIRNTQFAGMKVKDGMVDRLRAQYGRRPDSGSNKDKAVIYYHWKEQRCTLYLDTSGESLAKHSYRVHPGKAPLQEALAASIMLATQWDKKSPLVNPMCGSGTLAIEAALLALNKAPGLLRENFAFMHFKDFDATAWRKLVLKANQQQDKRKMPRILASDIRHQAIREAKDNARRAGVDEYIQWEVTDFSKQKLPQEKGVLIFNPEYGERLGQDKDLEELYGAMGDFLKQQAAGYWAYIFTGNLDLAKKVGLRPKRKMPYLNAKIECRLLEYELYEGTRRAAKNG